jgi:CheY-like chemotaxis protein
MEPGFGTDKPSMRPLSPEDASRNTALGTVAATDVTSGNPAFDALTSERPLRILVAEGNSPNRQAMLMKLSSLGYQAEVAENGLEAVEAIGRQSYDVVLMDTHMPELDGPQAAKLLRAHTGSAIEPWIVALTTGAGLSDREAWMAAGINGFLPKPVQTDDLASLLGRIVANHAAQFPTNHSENEAMRNFLNRDHARPVIEAYLADARATVSDLIAYAGIHDFEAVRRKTHYLKGSSMIVGASRVTSLCREIEARATAQQPLEEALDALHQAVEAASGALNRG